MNDFVLFDTEYTSWAGCQKNGWDAAKNQYKELVQIGAILVGGDTFEEKKSLSILIKPEMNPRLSDYFKELTHIDQSVLDKEGVTFDEGLRRLTEFTGEFGFPTFSYGLDEKVIDENHQLLHQKSFVFKGKTRDIRKIVQSLGVDTSLYSSGTLTECLGIGLLDYPHDAVNDVRSIRYVLHHFFKEKKLSFEQLKSFYGYDSK